MHMAVNIVEEIKLKVIPLNYQNNLVGYLYFTIIMINKATFKESLT